MKVRAILLSLFGVLTIPSNFFATTHVFFNELPPRLQWNENYGYCGEVSLIVAGLYYGQYCSQFTARALASPHLPQSAKGSQLLLGINDKAAATAMALASLEYKTSSESDTSE